MDQFYSGTVNSNFFITFFIHILFGLQIYADFSGYCDMAWALGRLFNIDLQENFRRPYFAHSIRNFWQRWHISLSTWFRDYIYIPLGGNKSGPIHSQINLFITFLLSGLWHGANWCFVLWGSYHGFLLFCSRWFSPYHQRFQLWGKSYQIIHRMFLLTAIFVGWIFFRAPSLAQLLLVLKNLINIGHFKQYEVFFHSTSLREWYYVTIFLALLFFYERFLENNQKFIWLRKQSKLARFAVIYMLLAICIKCGIYQKTPFIYFQF